MTDPVPRDAVDLHDALERYVALSEVALRACDENDAEGVHIALDARDVLGARVAALSATLVSARQQYDTPASASIFERLMAPIQATARHLEKIDEELIARVSRSRSLIGRQIQRLAQDDAGITAYAGAAPRADARLDLRR